MMSAIPTLQDLAFYARDHFDEDGSDFEASQPSSFDVVLDVYAHEGDVEQVDAHAGDMVRERLESDRASGVVPQPHVEEFVRKTSTYLRSRYPRAAEVKRDRQILSHLFWGHLVEARVARESSRRPVLT